MNSNYEKLKRIDGDFGKWNDASKVLPKKFGKYLVILESGALSLHAQTFAGEGIPETCTFCDDWNYPWNSRGSLYVAYWMPLPSFNKKWNKNPSGKGFWTDK